MKIKLSMLLLLASTKCFAVCCAAHGSCGHASVHSSAHVAAHEACIPHVMPACMPHAAAVNKPTNNSGIIPTSEIPKGVLVCDAGVEIIQNTYQIYQGCQEHVDGITNPNKKMSIEEFFKLHKPFGASKITMIIYNDHEFQIYYS